MQAHLEISGEAQYQLRRAVLIYENGDKDAVATLHPVRQKPEGPEIGAGRPLTRESLTGVWRELTNLPTAREILPAHVLYADGSRVLWWRPAKRRPIFFHTGRAEFDRDLRGNHVLYPPLLFLAKPGNLYVWSLLRDERPAGGTKLFRAPFLNLYDSGHMCSGTTKLPLEVTPDVKVFEKAFFETTFTHSNIQEALTTYPGGHDALWRHLAAPDAQPEWKAWLKPLKGQKGALAVAEVLNG